MSTPAAFATAELSPSMPYTVVTEPTPKYTLFRGSEASLCYASSPFVTKVEFRMRLAGVPYKLDCGAPWLGPKGKIPYLLPSSSSVYDEKVGGVQKEDMLGDSALIIEYLVETERIQDLNETLDPASKSKDLAVRALLEDKLYFYHMRECWIDNYYAQRDQALSGVPFPVRYFVGQLVYKKVVRTLFGQGAGRYTSIEVERFRNEIWHSIENLLGAASVGKREGQPFWCLGGDSPTEADLTLFGFISAILTGTSCPTSAALLRTLPTVMEYASLIHDRYFSEYSRWSPDHDCQLKLARRRMLPLEADALSQHK